jgi:hypothetical protein
MCSVRIALVGGLMLVALAVGLTLTRSPTTVIATDGIAREADVAATQRSAHACQAGETLPAGTSAIRLTLASNIGPTIAVTVMAGNAVATRGMRGPGWTGTSVTVPVQHVSHTIPDAKVCFALARPLEIVTIFGRNTPADIALTSDARKLPGRVGIEYVRQSSASWFSLLPSIARQMGFGRAWPGTWIVFALLAAMMSCAVLLCRLVVGELG